MMQHDRQITITTGRGRNSKSWRPQTLYISELYERLRVPTRSPEALEEYLKYPKRRQDDLKDVGDLMATLREEAGIVLR